MRTATNPAVEWIDATTDEPRRPGSLAAAAFVLLAVVVLVALLVDRDPPSSGSQVASVPVTLSSAAGRPWQLLPAVDGSTRDGWPRPMIASGVDVCFGFENLAFPPPPRPSLARCVDRAAIGRLDADQLVSLMTVRSGFDVWHVLLTGTPATAVDVRTVTGEPLDESRVHIEGPFVALRLPLSDPVDRLEWSAGRTVVRCVPPGDPNQDGRFCPAPGDPPPASAVEQPA